MSTVIENSLKLEVIKLHRDYGELRAEIDALLIQNSKKAQHRIIGAFTTAGAMVEKILLWIIKKEAREKQLRSLEGKQLGIFEYKKIIQEIIPRQQSIHINTIGQWRNHVAHANDIEDVDEHEINAINSALKSFVGWFFEDYLKNDYTDLFLEKNEKAPYDGETTENVESSATEHSLLQNNPENLRKKSKKTKTLTVIFSCIALICIVSALHIESTSKSNFNDAKIPSKKELNREEIYDLLMKYFNSSIDKNSDAHNFFATKIDRFYLYKDINPTEVDVIRKTEVDYIDRKNAVDKYSLALYLKTNGVSYWRFWNDFVCYRTTKRKYQTCKVLTEFGFNSEGKITSIKEIEVLELKFTKRKPY